MVMTRTDPAVRRTLARLRLVRMQMRAAGTLPEMECFDAGHIANAEPLRHMGLLGKVELEHNPKNNRVRAT